MIASQRNGAGHRWLVQSVLPPPQIMTDTGAYSDVVFGLFRLLAYRFAPRLADRTPRLT